MNDPFSRGGESLRSQLTLIMLGDLLLHMVGACGMLVESAGAQPIAQPVNPQSKFNFTISIAPTNAAVKKGESVVVLVTVNLIEGPPENVTLTLSGLPPETTFTFNPPSSRPSFTSTLVITTSPKTPSGTFHLTITCKNGNLTRTVHLPLTVLERPWSAENIILIAFLLVVAAGIAALFISARRRSY